MNSRWVLEVRKNDGKNFSDKFASRNDAIKVWMELRDNSLRGVLKQYQGKSLVGTYELMK